MRDRHRTIESLRRLAERPGTEAEGATAQALLERMQADVPAPFRTAPFDPDKFPRGTRVFYNYWAYQRNCPGVVTGKSSQEIAGRAWLRIKFDHLKQPRLVPITTAKGCHLSTEPLGGYEADELYHHWRDASSSKSSADVFIEEMLRERDGHGQ